MKVSSLTRATVSMVAVLAASCWTTSPLSAQQSLQTADGLLELNAALPQEVRAGEQFTYTIEVKNRSQNVVLHDIQLTQKGATGFTIENTSMLEGQKQTRQAQRRKTRSADASQQKSADEKQPRDSEQQAKDQQADEQQADQKAQQSEQSPGSMKIAMLGPGESRQIQVKASADQEGQLQTCLEVSSYRPAICLTAQVVKPELAITKQAPQQANRCEMIELKYSISNDGSGDIAAFQVIDELDEGLQTIDGEQSLQFNVDGLRAGDTREFVARVFATKPGSFSSRAEAKAEGGELTSRSKKTTTEVVAAELDVQVDGPRRLYGNQLAQFQARVVNTGNAVAEDVVVHVRWPQGARLADLGNANLRQAEGQQRNASQGTPTKAAMEEAGDQAQNTEQRQARNQRQAAEQNQQPRMSEQEFTIERIEPGEMATFGYALRTGNLEEIPTEVVAVHVCEIDQAGQVAQARSETTATAHTVARVVRLPALQVIVVDDEDPVPTDSRVTYSIRVWNEGDAVDKDIQLTAELPEGLKFEDAQGPTEFEVDGSQITFQPVDELQAGSRVDYRVTATSQGTGDVRFVAKVTSEAVEEEVTSEEPTRLFDGQASR